MALGRQVQVFFITNLFQVFVILWTIIVTSQVGVEAVDYSETYWQGPASVYEYESYRSARIFEFQVPSLTSKISFVFREEKSSTKCDDRDVQIHLQHGGLPVISPLNETFPEHFYLERSEPHSLHTASSGHTSLTIYGPLPGKWFVAAFLDGAADDRIQQKGFEQQCGYFLAATVVVERLAEVQEFGIDQEMTLTVTDEHPIYLRFHTLPDTWEYTLFITQCVFTPSNASDPSPPCPLLVATRGQAIPDVSLHDRGEACRHQGAPCDIVVRQPMADAWHNVVLLANSTGNLTLTFHVETQGCVGYFDQSTMQENGAGVHTNSNDTPIVQLNTTAGQAEIQTDSEPQQLEVRVESGSKVEVTYVTATTPTPTGAPLTDPIANTSVNHSCLQVPTMGRFVQGMNFKTQYQLRVGTVPFPNRIRLSTAPLVLQFRVLQDLDTGGTLYVEVDLSTNEDETQTVEMTVCLQKNSLPVTSGGVQCPAERRFVLTHQANQSSEAAQPGLLYIPYVESGMWYMAASVLCYNNATGLPEACQGNVALEFLASISPCLDGGCSENGVCREYFSGITHFSSCACIANWRGYACTDGSHAESTTIQLVEALLLTLSNLAFLPAIILGLYRNFYSEALVYTFTMFFSTFYHACDGNRKTVYCIMKYEVMAHCDFYGAIMSFWVTLIAMARLPDPVRAFLYVLGALGLAVGVEYDRHSLWTFLVPAALAFLIMAVCWIRECHRRRACFPSKRRWLSALLPGVLLALTGLMVFAFLETSTNYKYTHSLWHTCMALAVVCILPPCRNKKELSPSPSFTYDTFQDRQVESGDVTPLVMDVRNISRRDVLNDEQLATGASSITTGMYTELQDPTKVSRSPSESRKASEVV